MVELKSKRQATEWKKRLRFHQLECANSCETLINKAKTGRGLLANVKPIFYARTNTSKGAKFFQLKR